ncbi:hypothetical protein P168DRAFT_250559 [Aspergillus campestris IBT 28561]|uniref:DAGKc domain-containing protein n=1 Tax=Aspergillus campestris (strain IBT 28561) TaxID=1392248 RepID=A0A2I1D759_ASPC2|nr:uncharacterized protein P168DRAFT_250559 [Aspergillus campestris IBT 28561]PKY05704.1 hypothetical protein P168DRAFT_250559 [Aspergillus campestris IBT 28561]
MHSSPRSLTLAQSVRLSIQDDTLSIVDDRPSRRKTQRSCCGLLSGSDVAPHYSIPSYNLLNTFVAPGGLTITFVESTDDDATVNALQYPLAEKEQETAAPWADKVLEWAYGRAQRHKRLKVIINSFCDNAYHRYKTQADPIFAAAQCQVDVRKTEYRGHATDICEALDLNAYDAIICCSGDGLPHEAFNGLAKRPDAQDALANIAVAMIPCGSGNAMAWNLFDTGSVSLAALGIVKGLEMPMDLLSITQGDTHTVSFLSQCLGVLADCDLKTEHLRWMGDHRFLYGVFATLAQRTSYPCDLAVNVVLDDNSQIQEHYANKKNQPFTPSPASNPPSPTGLPLKFGTVQDPLPPTWETIPADTLASFYASNMAVVSRDTNFFPASLASDGLMDIMTIDTSIGWTKALEAIIKLPQAKCFHLPHVQMRKATAYRLTPRDGDGCLSVDGERYPFEAFQVEVHQGLARVLSKSGVSYEAPGPA